MDTDNAIIVRAATDQAAFGQLFDRHARPILAFLARRTSAAVAEDLLSETFLVAFERRRTYDTTTENALPWLFGIATRLLHRHRRDEVRAYRAFARVPVPADRDESVDTDDRIDVTRALADVARALAAMSTPVRDTVLLATWAELTYEQVAEATGVPIGTVRSRIARARSVLRHVPGALITLTGQTNG